LQLLQDFLQIIGHFPGAEECVQVQLAEIVEQTMEIECFDALSGQDRHVFNEKAHAGDTILALINDQASCSVQRLLDQFCGGG
jgi:hypothetical protein